MKEQKSEKPASPRDQVKSEVKPIRNESPSDRPKPTPNPPKNN